MAEHKLVGQNYTPPDLIALAVEGAQPLKHNGYKVPLVRNLVKRAIRGSGTPGTT